MVTVVAPWACESLSESAARGELVWRRREYRPGDIAGAWLVFAVTGDSDTDAAVDAEANAARVFCVRASSGSPAGATRSPAVLRRDSVVVSVSTTDRADPLRAIAVRDAIGAAMDSGKLPLRHRRRGGPGQVTLVGGGPGAGDLLTLRGRRALAAADVVVIDRLAPHDVLAELEPGVLVIEVGKAAGEHPVPQHEINQLLVDHARAGRRVVRLKGGDPMLFGRGAEEEAACRAARVDVVVVPGISSALAVPLAAGIPVTHRGLARRVTVLTGHDERGLAQADWPSLATGGGTIVVLMGVAALARITSRLLAHGVAADTPVAIVENGCRPDQRVTTGVLSDIATRAQERAVRAPAVIVIGAVAAFAAE